MNTAREMVDSLDIQLKEIASSYSKQFQQEFGVVTSSNELQTFMSMYDLVIARKVSEITQHLLLVATSEGIDNMSLLIEEVRTAKARTVSYLWRLIAGLRQQALGA